MNTDDLSNCDLPITVAYGGGLNSTAKLCGFRDRDIVPALITFADTAGEFPRTYDHVAAMSEKCKEWWGIEIETVRKLYQGKFEGLEQNCIRKEMLPSLAYGRKGCSMKYKVEPQTKRLKAYMDAEDITEVIRTIGYDAGEAHRLLKADTEDLSKGRTVYYRYPLVEWQWNRTECADALCRHGIASPGKSACFFCPASKRSEVINLKDNHPELLERALSMESGAQSKMRQNRGLGGENNLWAEWIEADDGQLRFALDLEPMHPPCGCYDG